MLELKEIVKAYQTASLVQVALNKVSVAFRDNEFVAVLGQSGSGKTTMLNVIGGLDRFEAGDLVIDGISRRTTRHATGTPTATTASASSSRPTT